MITFYATIDYDSVRPYMPDGVAYLFPASSFAGKRWRDTGKPAMVDFISPVKLPRAFPDLAADCGGFVATMRWGDYRYTVQQYVDWLLSWQPRTPDWAAMMDWCCEDEVTSGKAGVVQERQDRTTAMAYHMWQTYRDAPWCWVPTIQGWDIADYRRHARDLAPLIREMHAHYGSDSAFRVGLGTLCHRASSAMIRRVINTVASELPDVPLHLWGVKLTYLQSSIAHHPQVVSVDSAAWNGLFGTGNEDWRTSGMRRAAYLYAARLPQYQEKISRATNGPKQTMMNLEGDAA